MKTCSKCGLTKLLDEFYRKARGKHGVTGQCKDCMKKDMSESHVAHRAARRARQKEYYLINRDDILRRRSRRWIEDPGHKHHVSPEDYYGMLIKQKGRCAICHISFGEISPSIDHDHSCCATSSSSCGRCVRALLCNGCNAGLGQFRDDCSLLSAATEYLLRHGGCGGDPDRGGNPDA